MIFYSMIKTERYFRRGAMNKMFYISLAAVGLAFAGTAAAQLPSNPWTPHPNDGYFGDNVPQASPDTPHSAPAYGNNSSNGEILPVDPWARARDKTNTVTWRGSGQHGKLNYVGEATTYGTAMGQEMIAPEVNRHNMLVMTQHLRDMGYKIPASYDENIRNMPQNYAKYMRQAYDSMGNGNNPFDDMFTMIVKGFEAQTGLDTENLLFNTIDVLSTD